MAERAGGTAQARGRSCAAGQAAAAERDARHVRQVDQDQEREGGPRDAGRARLRHEGPTETAGGDSQRGSRGGPAQGQGRYVMSCDTIGTICNELCFCVFATLVTNTFILVNKVCVLLNVTGMLSTITIATKLYLSQANQRACYEYTET